MAFCWNCGARKSEDSTPCAGCGAKDMPLTRADDGEFQSGLSLAIVLTALACFPGGVALYYAVRAAELWDSGERGAARKMAGKSRRWSIAAIIVVVLLYTSSFLFGVCYL